MMHGVAITPITDPADETYLMHNGDCKVTLARLLAVGTTALLEVTVRRARLQAGYRPPGKHSPTGAN